MKVLKAIALVLVIVGGLNWLLVGLLDFNLVTTLLGTGILAKIVYTLVGLSALFCLSIFPDLSDTRVQ